VYLDAVMEGQALQFVWASAHHPAAAEEGGRSSGEALLMDGPATVPIAIDRLFGLGSASV
jgi:hypothetical protein